VNQHDVDRLVEVEWCSFIDEYRKRVQPLDTLSLRAAFLQGMSCGLGIAKLSVGETREQVKNVD